MVAKKSVASYVYFIEAAGCDLIKIGYTERTVETRLRQLRPMSPVPLAVIGVIAGSEALERELHLRFRSQWSHGEWFRKTDELVAYIASAAVAWEEPKAEFKRHLIAKGRLSDGEFPLSPAARLNLWAEAVTITYRGQTRTVAEWSKVMGITQKVLKRRIDGCAIPENLFAPLDDFSDKPSGCSPPPPMPKTIRLKRYGPLQAMLDAAREETP